MAGKLGNTDINKVYLGGVEQNKIYLGANIFFEKSGTAELYAGNDFADSNNEANSINTSYWVASNVLNNSVIASTGSDSWMLELENPNVSYAIWRLTFTGLDPAKNYNLTMVTGGDNADNTAPVPGNNFSTNDNNASIISGDKNLFFSSQALSSNTIVFSPDSAADVTFRLYPRFGSEHTANTGAGNVPVIRIAEVSLTEQ